MRVLAVSPGATESEFFDVAGGKPSGTSMPASAVVESMFTALDKPKSRPSVVVGRLNSFTAGLVAYFPKKSVIKMAGGLFLPKK